MAENPVVTRIVERVRADLSTTVARSVSRTWREVPAYSSSHDKLLAPDLTAHTETVFEAVLTSLLDGRRATADDFPITSSQARRRLRQGVTLPDFLTGFRIGQETLWEAIVDASRSEPEARDAALHMAIQVMNVIEVGSSVGAVAYLDAQKLEMAEGDRLRRDLMEDLLAGRDLAPGPKADLAEVSDLTSRSRVLVATAVPTKALPDEQTLREVVTMLRSVLDVGQRGIAVARQDHVVGVTSVHDDGSALITGLQETHRALARRGVHLSVGISTVHEGLDAIPRAHREAELARETLAGTVGVRPLRSLTPLDYLVMLDDPTSQRLIAPKIRRFVEDDIGTGGSLITTLEAYAAGNLNAKVAAAKLHLHVNSVYYRLDGIAERTGRDVRSFDDLVELLVAIRLLRNGRAGPRGQAGGGRTSA